MKHTVRCAALLLAAALLLSVGALASGLRFPDVPDTYWCAGSVNTMAAGGLIGGYEDGTFRPTDSMSVGAFLTIAARCAGTDYGADSTGYWCGGTVRAALGADWLPENYRTQAVTSAVYSRPITRETAIYILMKGLRPADKALGYTAADIPDFTSISADARDTILAAYNAGVTKGSGSDGSFAPQALLNRGQAAEILFRAGYTAAAKPAAGNCEVHYIDVGQADAILIRCGIHSMLIDGGNAEDSSLIVAYLKKYNITYLDDVVCTHAHEDHVGGLSGALNQAMAGAVYAPVASCDSAAFRSFLKYTAAQGLAVTRPTAGSTFSLGGAQLQVIAPQRTDYTEVNDTSIVLRMTYGSTSFLFTGDAGTESEKDMLASGLPLQSTVLKVGHHGSDSATSYAFLRAVAPQDAVISVGTGNTYGHPTEAVLSRLRDAGVTLYRTDLQGTIIASSDGSAVTFTTEKNASAQTNPTAVNGSGQNSQEIACIGNVNSHVFNRPTCSSLPLEKNQILFSSRQAAVEAGYTPCGVCNP